MGAKSKIGWPDSTWNFIRGCKKRVETVVRDGREVKVLSPACRNCYAARVASNPFTNLNRPGGPYDGLAIIQGKTPEWTGRVSVVDKHMHDPLRWKDPRRIFVNSMADLFNPKVPWDTIDDAIYVMQRANWHTFQVLTKYTDVMVAYAESEPRRLSMMMRNKHIQWGLSTENQEMFDVRLERVVKLGLETLWLSMEPLLGMVNMARYMPHDFNFDPRNPGKCEDCGNSRQFSMHDEDKPYRPIKWIVVGGESGDRTQIRMTEHAWFRYIRDQADRGGVPFFMKQLSQLEMFSGFAEIQNFPEDLWVQEWPEALAAQNGLF